MSYWRHRYESIIAKAYRANPCLTGRQAWHDPLGTQRKRGRPWKGKARCLVERLDHHQEKVLAFMLDFDVPFDNNLAERAVRMAKIRQKISGTFRSGEMADAFCRIRSFISTVRKQAKNVTESINTIFTDSPLITLTG